MVSWLTNRKIQKTQSWVLGQDFFHQVVSGDNSVAEDDNPGPRQSFQKIARGNFCVSDSPNEINQQRSSFQRKSFIIPQTQDTQTAQLYTDLVDGGGVQYHTRDLRDERNVHAPEHVASTSGKLQINLFGIRRDLLQLISVGIKFFSGELGKSNFGVRGCGFSDEIGVDQVSVSEAVRETKLVQKFPPEGFHLALAQFLRDGEQTEES
jgi:hypothetical protein